MNDGAFLRFSKAARMIETTPVESSCRSRTSKSRATDGREGRAIILVSDPGEPKEQDGNSKEEPEVIRVRSSKKSLVRSNTKNIFGTTRGFCSPQFHPRSFRRGPPDGLVRPPAKLTHRRSLVSFGMVLGNRYHGLGRNISEECHLLSAAE